MGLTMKSFLLCGAAAAALLLSACNGGGATTAAKPKEDAAAFLTRAEKELSDYSDYAGRVAWVNANFITDDTDWLNARAGSEGTQLTVRLANGTKPYEKAANLTPDQKRKMDFLRAGIVMPAPSTGTPEEQKAIADELNTLTTRMASTYGKGKFTVDGKQLNLEELSNIIGDVRDPKKLQAAWEGWRTISAVPQGDVVEGKPKPPTMAQDYTRMVEIGNAGAKELGFKDIADMWLSNYDMPSADMEKTVEKLWTQ
ncbi:MAG TPA: M2 family metallopeptidase, partial [Hyphomonadaceae bacterium]|nr:M2 family metallopeptidase [Hyphomonadaceae bacterium]